MANDAQQIDTPTDPSSGTNEGSEALEPISNGVQATPESSESSAVTPEAVITDITASSKAADVSSETTADETDSAAAASREVGQTEIRPSAADLDAELTDISLSQDLDNNAAKTPVDDIPPDTEQQTLQAAFPAGDELGSATRDQAAAVGLAVSRMDVSPSLDEPLPPSTTRIDSDAFFQDEDDESKFTLDEDEAPPQQPVAAAATIAAISLQEATEREAQDREDDEIQERLRRTREAAGDGDPSRTMSPPVANRPMSPPPGSAPRSPLPPLGVVPTEFRGLLYTDGVDTVGRPVVVVNARADAMLQPKLRNMAMEYMKRCLEPIVYQGPYVLVMVASGHQGDTSSKLPAMWLIRAYRSLSRPYKKNVKFIILVRPSAMLSTMMIVLRPFLSLKAARKLHKVDSLLDIEAATGGDVKAEQLGTHFLREELGVEPGASLTPTAPPARAESLDAEIQLGSYNATP